MQRWWDEMHDEHIIALFALRRAAYECEVDFNGTMHGVQRRGFVH